MQIIDPHLMQKELLAALPEFKAVSWVESIDSTNSALIRAIRDEQMENFRPALLGAKFQTHGKGRAGRKWVGKEDATLMFSCAFDVMLPPHKVPALGLVAGIAACEELRRNLSFDAQEKLTLKWPNDIMYQQAKLSGILAESVRPAMSQRHGPNHHVVVLGMGLNLARATYLSQELGRPIADWTSILDTQHSRENEQLALLVARIAHAWQKSFIQYQSEGLAPFFERFKKIDELSCKMVDVLQDDQVVLQGKAVGVDPTGALLVEDAQGQVSPIVVGDISIREA